MTKIRKMKAKKPKAPRAPKTPKKWASYEEVAAHLLDKFASHFGLGRVEGKQVVAGDSGTEWEIDAKGCSDGDESFVIVECKRHTKTGISQAITGGLAWSIQDTGASGGILVSPLGLQAGAEKVAKKAGIIEATLNEKATTTEYVLQFLNQVCIGLHDEVKLNITETLSITVMDANGNVVETRNIDG